MEQRRYDVFDFNGTLYDGECLEDFSKYVAEVFDPARKKSIPFAYWSFLLYKLFGSVRSADRVMQAFVKPGDDVADMVESFWRVYHYKLCRQMLERVEKSKHVAIVTSGPGFLIEGAKKYIGDVEMICSTYNLEQQRYTCINTGPQKAESWKRLHPNDSIDKVFTDTKRKDDPLWQIADGWLYIVEHGKIVEICCHDNAE